MNKQNISVTVDAVIINKENEEYKVLLIKRKKEPFAGKWAIPGGFLEESESPEEGAKRELEEETSLKIEKLWQIGAFGAPGRDPRGRIISIAFVGLSNSRNNVEGRDDAGDAQWFNIHDLPELAFDHREILLAAMDML